MLKRLSVRQHHLLRFIRREPGATTPEAAAYAGASIQAAWYSLHALEQRGLIRQVRRYSWFPVLDVALAYDDAYARLRAFDCPGCGPTLTKTVCLGYCLRCYHRLGVRLPPRTMEERFWSKVNKDGPTMPHMETCCWVWTGSVYTRGYGMCRFNGKTDRSHRVSWRISGGAALGGLHVLHRCDTRACVRPDHLFLGTPADNSRDMIQKGRHRIGPVRIGEAHHNAKLDEAAVRVIRADDGAASQDLAARLGVAQTTIWKVRHRRTWRHVM